MQLFYPQHQSVLQPEMLVKWKKGRGLYNFDSLPSKAIICVNYSLIKHLNTFTARAIKGLKGRHFVRHGVLFCSEFDNGASGIITLLEELRALAVTEFIFIGFAGILSSLVKEAEVYGIEKAISGNGATAYYSDKNELYPYDNSRFSIFISELGINSSVCFSIDTPFREVRPLLDELSNSGAHLIEMECAAVYAFGDFYQLSTSCFLMATDSLIENWQPPQDWMHVQKQLRLFINQLLPILHK
jgi:uridine phosphorylase